MQTMWAHHNAEAFGGDPSRMCLLGHSSGAHLVASAVLRDAQAQQQGRPDTELALCDVVRGCIGMSGVYDIDDHYKHEASRSVLMFDGKHPPLLLPATHHDVAHDDSVACRCGPLVAHGAVDEVCA